MKTTLLLAALLGLTALAPAADKADDKKTDRKSRTEKKDDKKDEKKEEVRNQFAVTITGAKDEAAEGDVKTFLSSIEGVKLEKSEKTDKGIEAVLSAGAKTKLSRGDISKALKDNADLKVAEFKAVRPGREKKEDKTGETKPGETKPEEKKPTEKKAS